MIDNQKFIEATNYLKFIKKVRYQDIALKIGINTGRMDNIRRNVVPCEMSEINLLVKHYPEVLKFFAENQNEFENLKPVEVQKSEVSDYSAGGSFWRELAETQKKLIEALEEQMERCRAELKDCEIENRLLKKMLEELKK